MSELNVEFGAGGSRPTGWVTHDIEVPIEGPLPYADNTVDKIRAEHVIEHVDSAGLIHFLDSCYRILKPGGMLRLCVPIITAPPETFRLNREQARDLAINHGHKCIHNYFTIQAALWIAGFPDLQVKDRDALDWHHTVIGLEKDNLETLRVETHKPL